MKNLINRIKCKLYGHKWMFGRNEIKCDRCGQWLVKRFNFHDRHLLLYAGLYSVQHNGKINFSKHTIVPLETLQVAEAACREAKYYKTAKELRKCLTAEK